MFVHLTGLFGLGSILLTLLAALSGLAVFGEVAVPDAPAGADSGAEGGGDEGGDTGADESTEPAADADLGTAEGDPDDDEDDDADLPPEIRDNPARLRTRLRRAQRQLGKIRPLAERLRGADGQPIDLDALMHKARAFDEFDASMRANPRLREMVYGREERPEPATEDVFDPESLPFEVDSDQGKYFAQQAQTIHEQGKTIKQLTARLDAITQAEVGRTVAQHEATWKNAAVAAAEKITDPVAQRFFIDAVYGRFMNARTTNQLGRLQPQQVIDAMLKEIGVPLDQKKRASAAAAQRIAEKNKALPRAAGRAGTAPASTEKKPTSVKEARGGFLSRYAG